MSKLTDSEWRVMEALWAGGPQTLGQVLQALSADTGWSRTTVQTYLTRMMAKGLVATDDASPKHYRAALSRAHCAAQERQGLLDRVYHGRAGQLVAAFLQEGSLTQEERDQLRRLLDEMEV